MLYSIDSSKYVTRLPHQADYDRWRKNISDDEYKAVEGTLNARIDASKINTAGWIPGHDWTGTVYEPIYEACGKNVTLAGMFFGLIVFKLLMERQDKTWGFGRYENNGLQIASMTYFELKNPPKRNRRP
ncbi:hypothetical protein [Candidatus Weimeria sp. HCP3S3_B5]|uniref:hypothetical protein n=1 Tax=Candidatus Weimeria sp. HCP3S3_B5 TaxID=3438871 RepID=UPI003F8C9C97